MTKPSKFFLKEGYIENLNTSSLDSDGKAPHEFWTVERLSIASYYQHHVYEFAARLARRKSLSIISDVGCGPAVKTAHFFGSREYIVNLYDQESCLSICSKQMPAAKFFAVDLERPIGTMDTKSDLVICSDVVEHLSDPEKCIEFCKRIAKRDGFIIFSTPDRDNLRGRDCITSGHPQHVREWNRDEFTKLLSYYGLNALKSKLLPQHALSKYESVRYRLTGGWHNPSKYRSCNLTLCSL
jgi:SAM-dependent methyltransferase